MKKIEFNEYVKNNVTFINELIPSHYKNYQQAFYINVGNGYQIMIYKNDADVFASFVLLKNGIRQDTTKFFKMNRNLNDYIEQIMNLERRGNLYV